MQGDQPGGGARSQDLQRGLWPGPPSPACFPGQILPPAVLVVQAGRRGPLGCPTLGKAPPMLHPSPHGLPGLAGAGSLQACELTLGMELSGIWSCRQLISKPVLLALSPVEEEVLGPKRIRQVEPVCELLGKSHPGKFLVHLTLSSGPCEYNSDSTGKTPETSSRWGRGFHQKDNAPFFSGVPCRPTRLRDGPGQGNSRRSIAVC